ncbi:glycosyltransferase family 4 protein [Cyclobacterium jeungdonense]|uniref:Glycosyltransferase family 4 protein n=1 Tax=Cyclobacterium jeungdonense TaxID=708087 RepID=A0ABT8C602_9BACT|nr:glycosyltransferase family 4 protein [Cyclobacterium jeungdonense]MDN3687165.1 glycosyltransferase family 4 protein [Cyclobacterium jeungdonense]
MRILYIHQYYCTPEQGGAIRSFHLAQGMAAAGLEVEVVSAHNEPTYQTRWDGKVKVHLLPVYYDNTFNNWRRIWSFYLFVKEAKKLISKLKLPDVFFISSTPLSTGLIGIWAKKKWRVPFVFEVRDLWPKAPLEIKNIRSPLLKKALYRMEYLIYRSAWKIVALSPGMQRYIQQRVPSKPVLQIPNFADVDFFHWAPDKYRNRRFEKQPLTLLYAGAVGEVNGLDKYLDLAEAAEKSGKNWLFRLMGKGKYLPLLKKEVANRKLSLVEFIPFGNKNEVKDQMRKADLAYISFLPFPVLEVSSPNKFFDALAMGMPVIVNFKGWIKDLILNHEIGLYQEDPHGSELLPALEKLENNPDLLEKMGRKARVLAETEFNKEAAVDHILDILEIQNSR